MPQLPTGIIGEFAHPPWGVIQRELIGTYGPGPVTASLQRVRGPINVDAFGIAWSVFAVPAQAGRRVRVVTEYEDNFMQYGVLYTDLTGHSFYGELADVSLDGQYVLFQQPLPTSVDIWIFPGFSVTLYWLLAL